MAEISFIPFWPIIMHNHKTRNEIDKNYNGSVPWQTFNDTKTDEIKVMPY